MAQQFAGFRDAQPDRLREVILPEDRERFDTQYLAALKAAQETLRLDKLDAFLTHWRRVAWSQHDMGHDKWRAMLAEADRRLAGGPPPPGMVSQEEMERRIQERLAAAAVNA